MLLLLGIPPKLIFFFLLKSLFFLVVLVSVVSVVSVASVVVVVVVVVAPFLSHWHRPTPTIPTSSKPCCRKNCRSSEARRCCRTCLLLFRHVSLYRWVFRLGEFLIGFLKQRRTKPYFENQISENHLICFVVLVCVFWIFSFVVNCCFLKPSHIWIFWDVLFRKKKNDFHVFLVFSCVAEKKNRGKKQRFPSCGASQGTNLVDSQGHRGGIPHYLVVTFWGSNVILYWGY